MWFGMLCLLEWLIQISTLFPNSLQHKLISESVEQSFNCVKVVFCNQTLAFKGWKFPLHFWSYGYWSDWFKFRRCSRIKLQHELISESVEQSINYVKVKFLNHSPAFKTWKFVCDLGCCGYWSDWFKFRHCSRISLQHKLFSESVEQSFNCFKVVFWNHTLAGL